MCTVDRCMDCIQYKVDHSIDMYDYCYRCHNKTMKWLQYDFGSFGLKCENCGARISADLNTPCEIDCGYREHRALSISEIHASYKYWDKCRYPHRPDVDNEA